MTKSDSTYTEHSLVFIYDDTESLFNFTFQVSRVHGNVHFHTFPFSHVSIVKRDLIYVGKPIMLERFGHVSSVYAHEDHDKVMLCIDI